MATEAARALRG
uniref:Uncharacterized protein n=1 Tax=Arundo donax TaxID=35708 RepID=A0A0A9AS80_ARUDO